MPSAKTEGAGGAAGDAIVLSDSSAEADEGCASPGAAAGEPAVVVVREEQEDAKPRKRKLNPLAADFRLTGDFLQLPSVDEQAAAATRHSIEAPAGIGNAETYAGKLTQREALAMGRAPWMKRPYNQSPGIALHEEIVDLVAYLSPTAAEARMREGVVARITEVVHQLWPKAVVEVLGSYRNGVYLPTSDIDLVVTGRWPTLPLRTLANALQREGIPSKMTVIAKARVPIIKFRDKATSVDVDISFNQPGGPREAKYILGYYKEYPALRPLLFVLKHFLAQRDLNVVFHGGLGSYSLLLSILSFLQMHPTQLPADANLGVLLMEYFELYGKHFNYRRVGISVLNGGSYFQKEEGGWMDYAKPELLCIQNPREPKLDTARASYQMPIIRQAFEHAFYSLTSVFARRQAAKPTDWVNRSMMGRLITIDEEILGYRRWVAHAWDRPAQSPAPVVTAPRNKGKSHAESKKHAKEATDKAEHSSKRKRRSKGKGGAASSGSKGGDKPLGKRSGSAKKKRRVKQKSAS